MKHEPLVSEVDPETGVARYFSDWLEEGKSGRFYFIDEPHVVTGTCKLVAGGYLVEYWVSGLSWSDYHDDFEKTPRLILKTTLGVKKKTDSKALDKTLIDIWNLQLAELALLAAIEGQMLRLNNSVTESEETNFHAKWHLIGHHTLGTFDEGEHSNPTTVRTARQYELLKSMGYTRPQKAILEFEQQVLETELMLTAVEGRLNTARNKKLIPLKEETEQNEEFFLDYQDWVDLR
jgi:hypothetical protein